VTDRRAKLAAIPIHERFLLDEETASIMCGVSLNLFRDWVKRGFITPVRLPGGQTRKLYRRQELATAVEGLPHEEESCR
jgi:hypothetical protein